MLTIVIITVIIALAFDFLNGMNDAANSIATIVATKVLSPFMAVAWAAFFNFAAVFFFGVKVATTIGKGIVDPSIVNEYVILGGLIGAIVWVYTCTHFGMPISVSHALIGGLMGPALLVGGTAAIIPAGITKVLVFIVLSPLIGLVLSYFIMILTMLASPERYRDHLWQTPSGQVAQTGRDRGSAQTTLPGDRRTSPYATSSP